MIMMMLRRLSGIAAAAFRIGEFSSRPADPEWPSLDVLEHPTGTADVAPVPRRLLERDALDGTLSRADGSVLETGLARTGSPPVELQYMRPPSQPGERRPIRHGGGGGH